VRGGRLLNGARHPGLGKEGVKALDCIPVDDDAAIPNKGSVHAVDDVVCRAKVRERDEGKAA
jgi:hypothetical protein